VPAVSPQRAEGLGTGLAAASWPRKSCLTRRRMELAGAGRTPMQTTEARQTATRRRLQHPQRAPLRAGGALLRPRRLLRAVVLTLWALTGARTERPSDNCCSRTEEALRMQKAAILDDCAGSACRVVEHCC
jgi:hypothetical protein